MKYTVIIQSDAVVGAETARDGIAARPAELN